ncbi:MAG: NAD(P)H-hydrate dehydratase [Phycisphaerae bacterium]|nr:NAD(P)H-hydrate dehydratase [Phycisphaerae bacterium]
MDTVTDIPKLTPRPADAHKSLFGRILIVGGSVGMGGACALAGRAALRAGAGLVRLAVPKAVLPVVAGFEPCYITVPLTQDDAGGIASSAAAALCEQAAQSDVVAFGPGAGTGRGAREVLLALIAEPDLRLVIDADGLNSLAKTPLWPARRKADVILTPHPGEMKRLWKGLFREPMPEDRTAAAAAMAKETGCTVVLKGAGTVVTDASRVYINTTGNPGMATAGTGDVLTGIIAALAGQHLSNFDAAVSGVYIHGLAGDLAADRTGQISLIATDIIDALPQAFQNTLAAQYKEGNP